MKKILFKDKDGNRSLEMDGRPVRENNWCEKYGYFIDLDACQSRSLNRQVCRRCYKSLLQLALPLGNV